MLGFRWSGSLVAVTLGLSTCTFFSAPELRAQTAQEIEVAKKAFAEGLALEEKSSFAQALAKFRQAAAIKKTPQILFHVGLCEARTGALVKAQADLEASRKMATDEGNTKVASAAQSELDGVQARMPMLQLVLAGEAKPTRITIDGKTVSADGPIPLDPGSHDVVAEYETGTVRDTVAVVDKARAKLELRPPAAASPAPPPPTATAPPTTPPTRPTPPSPPPHDVAPPQSHSNTLAYVALGVGGAGLVVGGITGVMAMKKKSDLDDSPYCRDGKCGPEAFDDVDSLNRFRMFSTIGFAVGVVGLGAGVTLLISGGSSDEHGPSARTELRLGPGQASVAGRF